MKNIVKLILIGLAIALVVLLGFMFDTSSPIADARYTDCVTAMHQAIPDPNDTEQRSEFLKNCYEQR